MFVACMSRMHVEWYDYSVDYSTGEYLYIDVSIVMAHV